jgi:hypothetical protein
MLKKLETCWKKRKNAETILDTIVDPPTIPLNQIFFWGNPHPNRRPTLLSFLVGNYYCLPVHTCSTQLSKSLCMIRISTHALFFPYFKCCTRGVPKTVWGLAFQEFSDDCRSMQEMLWAALMEPAIWADDEKPKPVEHAPDWPWLGLWFANRGRDSELYSKIIVLSCLSCAQVSLWYFWILECSGLSSFCRLFWVLEADFGSRAFQEARGKLGTSFGLLHNEAHGFHIHCTEAPEAHSIHAPSWLTLLASFLHLPSWAVVQTCSNDAMAATEVINGLSTIAAPFCALCAQALCWPSWSLMMWLI